jgi:rare lipoprotein A (peptidoglycan hydrolase)
MAWQRLLCVSFCAVALTSAAYGAQGEEISPPAVDSKPVLAKKHLVKGKTLKVVHSIKSKVATGNAKSRSVASAKPAKLGPHRERKPGQVGYASWYGGERNGQSTASGGRFDMYDLTAAHRTLPLDSRARVTNMANGRSVTVRITDRGPSRHGRIIDLSQSAAEELGMRNSGVARVHVEPFVPSNLP